MVVSFAKDYEFVNRIRWQAMCKANQWLQQQRRRETSKPAANLRPSFRLGIAVILCIASYFFFSRCIMTTVEIRGLSMFPTLQNGDLFLLNRTSYWYRNPERGDLVVIEDPQRGEFMIKRIVGLPGEQVQMRKNITHINGMRLMEPYLLPSALDSEDAMLEPSTRIPKDYYYVIGDNRNNSEDSRHYGPVRRQSIVGVVKLGNQPMAFIRTPAISAAAAERAPR